MSFPSKDADNETNTRRHAVADSEKKRDTASRFLILRISICERICKNLFNCSTFVYIMTF